MGPHLSQLSTTWWASCPNPYIRLHRPVPKLPTVNALPLDSKLLTPIVAVLIRAGAHPQKARGDKKAMRADLKEIIAQLKLERDVLKNGGYGRSVRTPQKPTKLFRDSVTCLNYGESAKEHPCYECLLWEWVPADHQGEDVPCHYISLNEQGDSIASLEDSGDRDEAEQALLAWLDSVIGHLQAQLAQESGNPENA